MKVCIFIVPYDSGHYGERMGCGPERLAELGLKRYFPRWGISWLRKKS